MKYVIVIAAKKVQDSLAEGRKPIRLGLYIFQFKAKIEACTRFIFDYS